MCANADQIHIPLDRDTGTAKGFAFVQFSSPEVAVQAFRHLDGTVFQGRLLHIVAATAKRESKLDEYALSKLPLKKQRQIAKKAEASSSSFKWNSMYMNVRINCITYVAVTNCKFNRLMPYCLQSLID